MRQNHPRTPASQPVISTGIFRGMKLVTPPGDATRPTGSKARQAVMNALGGRLPGSAFCDLFAGSGAMGIEALSRGASSCTFVDSGPMAITAIKVNLTECERRSVAQDIAPPKVRIAARDIMQLIAGSNPDQNPQANRQFHDAFDILWADPPYALLPEILPALLNFADSSLKEDGLVIVESGSSLSDVANTEARLKLKSEKKYGQTFITTWKKQS